MKCVALIRLRQLLRDITSFCSHLSFPVLEIERVSDKELSFTFSNVLPRSRVMSKSPKVVVSQHHDIAYKPSVEF